MSRDSEILASEQMRDRIADFLEEQADARDRRTDEQRAAGRNRPQRSKLLWGMAKVVRAMPGRPAIITKGR